RGLLGQGFGPSSLPTYGAPGVTGITDDKGRFRLSPYLGKSLTVIVSAPNDRPYLSTKKTVSWPKGAVKQEVAVTLSPGVLMGGQVTEADSSKPVAKARVDFWSKDLKRPQDLFPQPPDGTLDPALCKTDAEGRFRLIVPPGKTHLLVNGPT